MSNTYQNNRRRVGPDPPSAKIAVPEPVLVPMAEIAAAAREGLLVLLMATLG